MSPRERFGYLGILALLLFACGVIGARYLKRPAPIVLEPGSQASPLPSATQAQGVIVVHIAGAVKNPGTHKFPAGARVEDAILRAGGAVNADLDKVNLAARLEDGSQLYVPFLGEGPIAGFEALEPVVIRGPIANGRKTSKPVTKIKAAPQQQKSVTQAPPVEGSKSYGRLTREEVVIGPYRRYAGGPGVESAYSPSKKEIPSQSKAKPAQGSISLNSASQSDLQRLPGVGASMATRIIQYRQAHGGFSSIDQLLAIKGIGSKKLDAMRPYLRL